MDVRPLIKANTLLNENEVAILRKRKSWINILAIALMWFQVFAAMALFIFSPGVITFLLSALIVASKQFQMVIFMHDGAHGLIFKNRKLNDFVSQWFCAYPVLTDTYSYRNIHLQHHKYTETENDPDLGLTKAFPTTKRSLMRKVIRDMTGVAGLRRYKNIFVSIWGRDLTFKDHIKRFFKKTKGFLITNFLIFGILIISENGWLYLILWWVPLLTFFSLFYRIRSITEHSGVLGDDDFNNTRTTIVPWFLKYFLSPLNVNYHVEHHLFTFCPWYNLPKAHQMLKEKGYLDRMEISYGYSDIFKKIITT
jgi:fatty acid desaturase